MLGAPAVSRPVNVPRKAGLRPRGSRRLTHLVALSLFAHALAFGGWLADWPALVLVLLDLPTWVAQTVVALVLTASRR